MANSTKQAVDEINKELRDIKGDIETIIDINKIADEVSKKLQKEGIRRRSSG